MNTLILAIITALVVTSFVGLAVALIGSIVDAIREEKSTNYLTMPTNRAIMFIQVKKRRK